MTRVCGSGGGCSSRGGSSGSGPGREEQVVRRFEPVALGIVGVDDLVEGWAALAHRSSSSASASRASPLRVRVLTVPSGIERKVATSLCESPEK